MTIVSHNCTVSATERATDAASAAQPFRAHSLFLFSPVTRFLPSLYLHLPVEGSTEHASDTPCRDRIAFVVFSHGTIYPDTGREIRVYFSSEACVSKLIQVMVKMSLTIVCRVPDNIESP